MKQTIEEKQKIKPAPKYRLFSIILAITFFSGSIYLTDDYYFMQRYLLVGTMLLIPCSFMFVNLRIKVNMKMLFVFFCFTISCFISSMYNSDEELFIAALTMLGIYITLVIVVPAVTKESTGGVIFKSILIVHIPILFIPLIFTGLYVPYGGIFYGGSVFGGVMVTTLGVVLSMFVMKAEEYVTGKVQKKRGLFFLLIVISAMELLVLYSNSRNSALTSFALLLLAFHAILRSLKKNIKMRKLIINRTIKLSILFTLFVVPLNMIFDLKGTFETTILHKFQMKESRGDVLDMRGYIWDTTIREAGLFGNGRDYFSKFGLGSHNTYISILGQFGWIAAIMFCVFMLMAFRYSYRYAIKENEDRYKYLPLMLVTSFMTLSFAEGMLLKVSMLGTFAVIGYTSSKVYKRSDPMHSTQMLTNIKRKATTVDNKVHGLSSP